MREVPVEEHEHLHVQRQGLRRVWARVARNGFISSRTLVRGWGSTACLGFLSLFPLALRVLTPLAYGRFVKRLNRAFLPEPKTEQSVDRVMSTDMIPPTRLPLQTTRLAGGWSTHPAQAHLLSWR